jgi:hypothetical protein
MKKLFLIPLALGLIFCTSQKTTVANNSIAAINPCPEDGICTAEIQRNKGLEIKSDDLGSIYYQLIDSPETSVIIYQYNRTVDKDLQDGNYREEIIFEIKNSESYLKLNDIELQQTKLLFGRFCYCKGQTGYYKVEKGKLNLNQKNNVVDIGLEFTITQVPQIIKAIQTSIK